MAKGTIVQKIIDKHFVSGEKTAGCPVALQVTGDRGALSRRQIQQDQAAQRGKLPAVLHGGSSERQRPLVCPGVL